KRRGPTRHGSCSTSLTLALARTSKKPREATGRSVISELSRQLGPRLQTDLSGGESELRDSSSATPQGLPLGIVHAESTADVSVSLKWASTHGVPVSVRGAGTGLSGGAVAHDGGLVISLERMKRVLSVE